MLSVLFGLGASEGLRKWSLRLGDESKKAKENVFQTEGTVRCLQRKLGKFGPCSWTADADTEPSEAT